MLRELRAESGAPHFGTRLLALVLVLLLGGPLTYYLVRGANERASPRALTDGRLARVRPGGYPPVAVAPRRPYPRRVGRPLPA